MKCNKSRWRCTSVIDAERHLMLTLYKVKKGLLMCYNGCQRSFNVAERDCTVTTDRQGQAGADEADVWLCWLSWWGSSPANEPCARQRDRAVQRHNMTATGRETHCLTTNKRPSINIAICLAQQHMISLRITEVEQVAQKQTGPSAQSREG